jgi:hypothetical protein
MIQPTDEKKPTNMDGKLCWKSSDFESISIDKHCRRHILAKSSKNIHISWIHTKIIKANGWLDRERSIIKCMIITQAHQMSSGSWDSSSWRFRVSGIGFKVKDLVFLQICATMDLKKRFPWSPHKITTRIMSCKLCSLIVFVWIASTYIYCSRSKYVLASGLLSQPLDEIKIIGYQCMSVVKVEVPLE